jgi:peptidoglycan/LPS O-acetylase OafA/YrhL
MPVLDGIRGFAIVLTIAAHYYGEVTKGLRILTAGWIGVDLFFSCPVF